MEYVPKNVCAKLKADAGVQEPINFRGHYIENSNLWLSYLVDPSMKLQPKRIIPVSGTLSYCLEDVLVTSEQVNWFIVSTELYITS